MELALQTQMRAPLGTFEAKIVKWCSHFEDQSGARTCPSYGSLFPRPSSLMQLIANGLGTRLLDCGLVCLSQVYDMWPEWGGEV